MDLILGNDNFDAKMDVYCLRMLGKIWKIISKKLAGLRNTFETEEDLTIACGKADETHKLHRQHPIRPRSLIWKDRHGTIFAGTAFATLISGETIVVDTFVKTNFHAGQPWSRCDWRELR